MKPGYSESDGLVILAMSREDYNTLLLGLGYASSSVTLRKAILRAVNRINDGNPHFVPYEIAE